MTNQNNNRLLDSVIAKNRLLFAKEFFDQKEVANMIFVTPSYISKTLKDGELPKDKTYIVNSIIPQEIKRKIDSLQSTYTQMFNQQHGIETQENEERNIFRADENQFE